MITKTSFISLTVFLMILGGCSQAEEPKRKTVVAESEKSYLLTLARQTLVQYLKEGTIPDPDESGLSERLTSEKGCFVTLEKKGIGLRGCIGYIFPVKPLYRSIIDNTVSAAVRDRRFPKVTEKELPDINIGISVLTVPRELDFTSGEDLLEKLVPLRDGVVLKTRYGTSTYLPQVWEDLPGKEEFLSRLCRKHGAPADEWRNGKIEVLTYQAAVFKETGYGGK